MSDKKPIVDQSLIRGGRHVVERDMAVRIDRLVIQEFITRGQAVESWAIDTETEAGWAPIARGTTIGYKRIATFPPVTTRRVRLTIEKARASLAISTVGAYLAPASR